jgi:hypothetical protein
MRAPGWTGRACRHAAASDCGVAHARLGFERRERAGFTWQAWRRYRWRHAAGIYYIDSEIPKWTAIVKASAATLINRA